MIEKFLQSICMEHDDLPNLWRVNGECLYCGKPYPGTSHFENPKEHKHNYQFDGKENYNDEFEQKTIYIYHCSCGEIKREEVKTWEYTT